MADELHRFSEAIAEKEREGGREEKSGLVAVGCGWANVNSVLIAGYRWLFADRHARRVSGIKQDLYRDLPGMYQLYHARQRKLRRLCKSEGVVAAELEMMSKQGRGMLYKLTKLPRDSGGGPE